MYETTLDSRFGFYHKSESIDNEESLFESKAYMEAFLKVSQDTKVLKGDFEGVISLVCQALQQTMGVSRVSYWDFCPNKNLIRSKIVFPSNEIIPESLSLKDFPIYGDAVKGKGIIVAHEARRFNKTSEFRDVYLVPENIFSMLDAPVIFEGELLGVLCCEHKNEIRNWNTLELFLISILSGLITITWQNRALRTKSEKIAEQFEELESFNSVVSTINKKLKTDNLGLTNELADQNKLLKIQNGKLREFAQMNSHQIRGPVSSILELVDLRKYTNLDYDKTEWMNHLIKASSQLDDMVSQMNESLKDDSVLNTAIESEKDQKQIK